MKQYRNRIYDTVLWHRLEAKGAVLVEGPKWCGKTTTCLQLAQSVLYMAQPDIREQNIMLADMQPSLLLHGATPRLIDEWQIAPKLWDAVRLEVDQRDEFNQFLLTGSSVPPSFTDITHTGTGRIARLRMRPMSLYESGDSTGAVSFASLFEGESMPLSRVDSNIEHIAFLLCRGGWPKAIDRTERIALQQSRDYLDAIVESDISRVDDVQRDPHLARRLLRSYARMESSQSQSSQIAADVRGSAESPSDKMPAWNPNLRSKSAIRTSDTRHFVDPSIAAAALGIGPAGLIKDFETFGLLFESMCVRDFRVYADALDGDVFHFRDRTGLECDAVLHLRDGRYGLIEVKLGGNRLIEEGAANLIKLADKIDTTTMPKPSFLMVVTGTGEYSFTRRDGVMVAPIRTLRP